MLFLCLVHGVWTVRGLTYPPDVDSLRDIGFAQAILDGDPFGDAVYAGETRWYPPLVPALVAFVARLFNIGNLPAFWVQSAPWINLLVPTAFFMAARRLLGSETLAASALLVFVLMDGVVGPPWVTGGYTPWPFTPTIGQALFLATLWLILAQQRSDRWLGAALTGAAIGLTFLAHPIPAIILTLIVTTVILGVRGLRIRSIGWLAVVAISQLAVMSLYLGPIVFRYPAGVLHSQPGLWSDLWMLPEPGRIARVLIFNVPGLLALLGVGILYRKGIRLERGAAIALVSWVGLCSALLARHYACSVGARLGAADLSDSVACRTFVVPVHHYHLYLQIAWAMLIGFVGWHALQQCLERGSRLVVASVTTAAVAFGFLGSWSLLTRKFDANERAAALHASGGSAIDLDAYHWILSNTKPSDTFATQLIAETKDASAFAVHAAARKLVAAPLLHSSPYVSWEPRDATRREIIAAATGIGPSTPLCSWPRGTLWVVLPVETPIDAGRVEPAYATDRYAIYRVRKAACRRASEWDE